VTPEARAWMLAALLDGATLRLTNAAGDEYGEGTGYKPHRVAAHDVTLEDAGTEALIRYTWVFDAPGPSACGCRLTRAGMVVFEGRFSEPFAVKVAGTEVEGSVRLILGG
jgi:hypothetical protein